MQEKSEQSKQKREPWSDRALPQSEKFVPLKRCREEPHNEVPSSQPATNPALPNLAPRILNDVNKEQCREASPNEVPTTNPTLSDLPLHILRERWLAKLAKTPTESRQVMLVFDCNGTLTSLSERRRSHGFNVRPGVQRLAELAQSGRFLLSLWTSAMSHNMYKMKTQIETTAGISFTRALHRSHCRRKSNSRRKKGFETVKPLRSHFGEKAGLGLHKVILIDDDIEKAERREFANLLLVPPWREDLADQVIPVLVDHLMKLDCSKDVRPQIQSIQDAVWVYFKQAYPSSTDRIPPNSGLLDGQLADGQQLEQSTNSRRES